MENTLKLGSKIAIFINLLLKNGAKHPSKFLICVLYIFKLSPKKFAICCHLSHMAIRTTKDGMYQHFDQMCGGCTPLPLPIRKSYLGINMLKPSIIGGFNQIFHLVHTAVLSNRQRPLGSQLCLKNR